MMSSSARPSRVIRAVRPESEVFVVGGAPRRVPPVAGPTATAAEIIAAAEQQAADMLAETQSLVDRARADADHIRAAARAGGHEEGYRAGHEAALAESASLIQMLRTAAAEGEAIRGQVVAQASAVITRAVVLAVRRLVADFYDDPARTAAAVAEAVRAASGQEILSIRVHPAAEAPVTAALADLAGYVRPDDGIEVGGCIIDLRNGTLDATLDARLSLMERAIRAAGGDDSP
jgi:flagellar biosynthesis/type III secretory pathway protein FliH